MNKQSVKLVDNRFEILTDGDTFVGLGAIHIGDVRVRSGRLPLRPYTQTFTGQELSDLKFLGIDLGMDEVRIKIEAQFRPLPVKLMRDHSFDPIHETADWDGQAITGKGRLDIVLRPARDRFNNVDFAGFSYHYDWKSETDGLNLFYILDMASWELGGDIERATVVSQSSCSPPVATFARDTAWTTEGVMHWVDPKTPENLIMTHNLPRWAGHGDFDFQFKGNDTLVGVFDHVELIRSLVKREAGKPELKTFDKHIFDNAATFQTSPKKIMINRAPKSVMAQKNLWSWMFEDIQDRAREEYGVKETPFVPFLFQNFWVKFTVDSYYKDLLPAGKAIGIRKFFLDNLKRSAMTAKMAYGNMSSGNMCGAHEFEIADELGGIPRVKAFIEESKKCGISPMCWTNNVQAHTSPLNPEADQKRWYVLTEDTRQKWGGAYSTGLSAMDLAIPEVRDYFVKSHIKIRDETGMDAFFFDSFYNLAWMTVSYRDMKPRTQWRALIQSFKELRDAGIEMSIESFGPWGAVTHGHPSTYDIPNIFACYKVGVGNDYSTIPTDHPLKNVAPTDPAGVYYSLAHLAGCHTPLHENGKRIDEWWTQDHIQALADFHAALPNMQRRYLQEDNRSVIWHDSERKIATIFNFADRTVALPGRVKDLTTGQDLPSGKTYDLKARHTYTITGGDLPTTIVA